MKAFLKDRFVLILIFLGLIGVFIWPTPFEWDKQENKKVWRFGGGDSPWHKEPIQPDWSSPGYDAATKAAEGE